MNAIAVLVKMEQLATTQWVVSPANVGTTGKESSVRSVAFPTVWYALVSLPHADSVKVAIFPILSEHVMAACRRVKREYAKRALSVNAVLGSLEKTAQGHAPRELKTAFHVRGTSSVECVQKDSS